MATNQNQGMMIGMIIFAILTVICGAIAVVFVKQTNEMTIRLKAADDRANTNEATANANQEEIFQLKDLILPVKDAKSLDRATLDEIKAKYKADLDRFGKRLAALEPTATTATYSESLAAALNALDQRNTELEKEKANVADWKKQKEALDGIYQAQVKQFETAAMTADQERIAAKKAQTDAEAKVAALQEELNATVTKHNDAVNALRAEMQKPIADLEAKVAQLTSTLNEKQRYIEEQIKGGPQFAATYDGNVTRINPSARTVWINLGSYDLLQKHVTFSVQPREVPAGSDVPPKGKIEVMEILGDHLAECRILEDDLENPIIPGDNIYTSLWQAGQRTRFAFAGKIDLNDDGSDDMDQVRGLVQGAGGQIDAEILDGKEQGQLTIETRYLVLGGIPADKASADVYNAMINKAVALGVQRVPVSVFLDQIGYKKDSRRIQFGGGSLTGTEAVDPPDGGPRVSTGKVTDLFQRRRPAAAPNGSAY